MKISSSGFTHRPCLWLALALSFGILIGCRLPWPSSIICLGTSFFVAIIFYLRPRTYLIYLALIFLGGALVHVRHAPEVEHFSSWRLQLKNSLYNYLDEKEAGVMTAMVIGDRSQMPKELNMLFKYTGTNHILAISGMNMSILAGMFFLILKILCIPRRWQYLGTIICLFVYAVLTGASASVMRSAWMASVVLGAMACEYESDVLNSLGLAALILLLMNARYLFDIGFQLSFAAVAAIVLMYESLNKNLSFLPSWIASALAVSLSAWMGTAPLQLWHFGSLTPVGVLANIPIVPLADIAVALGLLLALAGIAAPILAIPLAGCLKVVLNFMIVLAQIFAQIPFGFIHISSC